MPRTLPQNTVTFLFSSVSITNSYFGVGELHFTAGCTRFDNKMNEQILEELEAEPAVEETKKIQIQLATTCYKHEQQQHGKNCAELQTEWTKTALKNFEETIRRC